jgi:hypothetical protein
MTLKNKSIFGLFVMAAVLLGSTAIAPQAFAGVSYTISVDPITSPTADNTPVFTGTMTPAPAVIGDVLIKVSSDIDGTIGGADIQTDGSWIVGTTPLSEGTHNLRFVAVTGPPEVSNVIFRTLVVDAIPDEDQIEDLIEDVESLGLSKGNENALTQKLDGAYQKITNDNPNDDNAACGMLQSFINQLNALVNSGKLLDSDVSDLIDEANIIIDSIGC